MHQSYLIFINDIPVYLCDRSVLQYPGVMFDESHICAGILNREKLLETIEMLERTSTVASAHLVHSDLETLRQMFFSLYTVVEAAGGAVFNPVDALLLIYRRGRWDLPKGKIDEGESAEAAAIREVAEETGIYAPAVRLQLTDTYHTYRFGGKRYLKHTHWFILETESLDTPIPQQSEDIEKVIWAEPERVEECKKNMWASVKMVVDEALFKYQLL